MEQGERLRYYTDPTHVTEDNVKEIVELLGLGEKGRLNFDYPQKIATLFQVKLDTLEYYEVMAALDEFYQGCNDRIEHGITIGELSYFPQRKDYSKRDVMVGLSGGRENFWYKLQLYEHDESQFIKNATGRCLEWTQYFKPDFTKNYRHDIVRAFDPTILTYLDRIRRLIDYYEDSIKPLLLGVEFLHEHSDGAQLQTSRIVRVPNLQDIDTTFGWLLMEHRPHIQKIKGHEYDQDHFHIGFYQTRQDLIDDLKREQQSMIDQKIRLEAMLLEISYSQGGFSKTTVDQRIAIMTKLQLSATGLNRADKEIRQSTMGNRSRMIDRKVLQKIHNRIRAQIYKNTQMQLKNRIHIKSLETYDM